MPDLTTARVSGHTLRAEGAPHAVNERGDMVRVYNSWGGVGGFGRGLCSCGEFSALFDSANQRKKWHRAHKAEIATNPTPANPQRDTAREGEGE